MSVTATLAGEFTKLLIRQHGSRLVGQDFWNLLVRHLGEVERAYEACERTPEGHVPPDESEDHEEFLGSEAYVVAGAMARACPRSGGFSQSVPASALSTDSTQDRRGPRTGAPASDRTG